MSYTQKLKVTTLAVAIGTATFPSGINQANAASDIFSPKISGSIAFELQNDNTFSSDDVR